MYTRFKCCSFVIGAYVSCIDGATISLSGTVLNFDNTPKQNVVIYLANSALQTNTDSLGKWALSNTTTSIDAKSNIPHSSSKRLEINNRVQLICGNTDVIGRRSSSNVRPLTPLQSNHQFSARAAETLIDTLCYSWNGKIFSKDTAANLIQSGLRKFFDTTWNTRVVYGRLVDSRDSQEYRTITVKSQIWMAENLRFRIDNSWCYDNSESNCNMYGRMYRWSGVMMVDSKYDTIQWGQQDSIYQGICPQNWHIPRPQDWIYLTDTVLSHDSSAYLLKKRNGWYSNSTANGNGIDSIGFHAEPVGMFNVDYTFGYSPFGWMGNTGNWWNSTEGIITYMTYYSQSVEQSTYYKKYGAALRCIHD